MKQRDVPAPAHLAPLGILLLGCLSQVLFGYFDHDLSGHALGADDAFISYRYAENLVAGHGLVFNPGERVEGYSNLLYVLLLAPAFLVLPPDQIYAFSVGLNLLLIALTYLAFVDLARSRLTGWKPLFAATLFALTPSIWIWVGSGMETPLVLLLLVLTWRALETALADGSRRAERVLVGLAALSVVVRADAFLIPLAAAGFCLLQRRPALARRIAVSTGVALASYVAWRLWYYGYPFPNTYYAKVSGRLLERWSDGVAALWNVGTRQGLIPYLGLLAYCLVRAFTDLRAGSARRVRFEAFFGILWVAYFTYLGGDALFDRLLVPIFPLGILLALRESEGWTGKRFGTAGWALLATALVVAHLTPFLTDVRLSYRGSKYDRWVTLGRFLRENHPGDVIAVDAAGKVPFFSGLRTIDMLGLNDAHIAHGRARPGFRVGHNKFDPSYVLRRRPDLIAAWTRSNLDVWWGIDRARYRRAGYRIRYLCSTHPMPPGPAILDVAGFPDARVRSLRQRGYAFAVLELQE